MTIEVNGKTYETDEEGYLADLNQWEPEVATSWPRLTTPN